jgi:hypothetical protein
MKLFIYPCALGRVYLRNTAIDYGYLKIVQSIKDDFFIADLKLNHVFYDANLICYLLSLEEVISETDWKDFQTTL